MKKINDKIRARFKGILAIMCLLMVCSVTSSQSIRFWGAHKKEIAGSLGGSFMFVGMVASMKKKGLWDTASKETQAFAEEQDEAMKANLKNYLELTALDEKLKTFEKAVEDKLMTKEQLGEFADVVKGYKTLAEELTKLKDQGIGSNAKVHHLMTALKEGKGVNLKGEATKHSYADFASKAIQNIELQVKATEQASDIATHTIGVRVPGIGQLPTRKPFIMDLFKVVPVNTEYIKYMDQETIVRDAKNVYGIATSTHNTKVTWKERQIQIMKIRDFVYTSIDMLNDYDFVMGEIQALLESSVMLKVDDQLLNGTGTSPEFHSISEYSAEFDATNTMEGTIEAIAGTIQAPNVFDLCIAMASHVAALGKNNNYRPDTILWNSLDAFKSMLVKDKNDQYILPPFVNRVNDNEYNIHGMRIISNPNVPANSIYLFDSTKGTIYMRKGFGIEMAYNNNDDFEREQVTTKAYVRLNFFVRNVDQNAFMKCTDVEAALVALSKPGL